jgi:aspartate-semialdehyde dehydrogenase
MSPGPGKIPRVAIVGASSLRGKELKQTLEDRCFPASDIVLLDESVMAGTLTEAGGEPTFIRALEADSFEDIDFAFFGGAAFETEQTWAAARAAGATVIDLTGALAAEPQAEAQIRSLGLSVGGSGRAGNDARTGLFYAPSTPVIVAATIAMALGAFNPRRVALLMFPPVSEHDQPGIAELESQTTNLLSFRAIEHSVFGAQVAFNLFSEQLEGGRPRLGEMRDATAREVTRLLEGRAPVPAIQLVQAPVFYGYAFAGFAEFESAQPEAEQLEAAFANLGVKIAAAGDPAPTNVSIAGESEIHMARIRRDSNVGAGVWLWGAADNLRLAATNAVRIMEELLGKASE